MLKLFGEIIAFFQGIKDTITLVRALGLLGVIGFLIVLLVLAPAVAIMLGLISVLIIAHEMGHFFVAKKCGVRVERFGFGLPFGPTLWSKKVGETEYCIHAALFGGYVAFPDDNPDSAIPKDSPERFENQPVWNRAAIAIAGVTVNAIMGWLLMFFVITAWGIPSMDVRIDRTLSAQTPAAMAGIRGMELIQAINGKPVEGYLPEERLHYVTNTIGNNANTPIVLTLQSSTKEGKLVGQPRDVRVTPDKNGKIGIQLGGIERYIPAENPLDAAGLSTRFLTKATIMNFEALGKMLTGNANLQELSGPIGIVNQGAQIIDRQGIQKGLMLAAFISIILAVMNLLPIPALDGGHLLFIFIEAVRGKPVQKEVQERFVQVGFIGLLALMVFVLLNDINNNFINPVSLPK